MESAKPSAGPQIPATVSRFCSRLDSLCDTIERELSRATISVYPSVRLTFQEVGKNYLYGLSYLKYIAEEVLVNRAADELKLFEKDNPEVTIDNIVREVYNGHIRKLYLTAQELQRDFLRQQMQGQIPHEVYLWVADFLPRLVSGTRFIFQEDVKFENEDFTTAIIARVRPLAELTQPTLDSSIKEFGQTEYSKKYKFVPGSIISYAESEAKTPAFWPIIMHEVFHIVSDKNLYLDGFLNFPKQNSVGGRKIPLLDKDSTRNHNWMDELLVDHLALRYFGPVYAFSLCEYFSRYPSPKTDEHPSEEVRLLAAAHYLEGATKRMGKFMTEPFMVKVNELLYGKTPDLEGIQELSELLEMWANNLGLPTYEAQLKRYQEESSPSKELLDYMKDYSKDTDLIAFKEPPFKVEDIRRYFFEGLIPIAIHPNILFNVVFANYKEYDSDVHLTVLVESIKKWRILESWQESLARHKTQSA